MLTMPNSAKHRGFTDKIASEIHQHRHDNMLRNAVKMYANADKRNCKNILTLRVHV